MKTAKIQPTYITLSKKPQPEMNGSALAIVKALKNFDGKATYKQLCDVTKLSTSALYSLVKQLKEAKVVDVVKASSL